MISIKLFTVYGWDSKHCDLDLLVIWCVTTWRYCPTFFYFHHKRPLDDSIVLWNTDRLQSAVR